MRDWSELMERESSMTALHTILSAEHLLDDYIDTMLTRVSANEETT